jgi:hypothetical protein
MRRPDAQRVIRLRGPFGHGSLSLGPRLSWHFVLALSGAALVSGCDAKKPEQSAEAASKSAEAATKPGGSSGQQAEGRSSEQHSGDNHESSAHPPGPLRPAGPPAIALSDKMRADLTAVSVMAHVGNVLIRKQGKAWVMRGRDGCTVQPRRLERALDNLANLRAVSTNQAVPEGSAFQLQIDLLIEEERAIHLEVADRNEEGDLARLENDSMVRVKGLDRGLWSPHPADWCREP